MLGIIAIGLWCPIGVYLAPMVFNIYIKLLAEVVQQFGAGSHQYVDGIQLYLFFPSHTKRVASVLECCLEAVGTLMSVNQLGVNSDKVEVLLIQKTTTQG